MPHGTLWEEHYRFIEWHARDWKQLRGEFPGHRLIAGGDYNQNRDGARWHGTRKGRDLLAVAMSNAGLKCVTEEDFVKTGKLRDRHTVDHLCLDGTFERTAIDSRGRPSMQQFMRYKQ